MRLIVGGGVTYALAIGLGYGYANGLFDGGRTSQGPGPRSIEGPTHHNTPPTDHNHNHVHHHDNNGIPSCGHVSITDTERHNTFGKNAACYDIGNNHYTSLLVITN